VFDAPGRDVRQPADRDFEPDAAGLRHRIDSTVRPSRPFAQRRATAPGVGPARAEWHRATPSIGTDAPTEGRVTSTGALGWPRR
jgi:hypothetical protein